MDSTTREDLSKAEKLAREYTYIPLATDMKAIGKMTSSVDREHLSIKLASHSEGSGKMASQMEIFKFSLNLDKFIEEDMYEVFGKVEVH